MPSLKFLERFYFGPQCTSSFIRRILELNDRYGDIYLGLDIDLEQGIPYLAVYQKEKNVTMAKCTHTDGASFGVGIAGEQS